MLVDCKKNFLSHNNRTCVEKINRKKNTNINTSVKPKSQLICHLQTVLIFRVNKHSPWTRWINNKHKKKNVNKITRNFLLPLTWCLFFIYFCISIWTDERLWYRILELEPNMTQSIEFLSNWLSLYVCVHTNNLCTFLPRPPLAIFTINVAMRSVDADHGPHKYYYYYCIVLCVCVC